MTDQNRPSSAAYQPVRNPSFAPYHHRCADCGHTDIEHDFPSGACGICVECVTFETA